MTKLELEQSAWATFWKSIQDSGLNVEAHVMAYQAIFGAGFKAGYEARRAKDIAAMCYMCANPERYKSAEKIEGSLRLFHFVGSDNWNAGQCWAQPLLDFSPPLCKKCGRVGMLTDGGICTYDCTPKVDNA